LSSPIFISYSHRDRNWLTILQTYLKPYVPDTEPIPWDDGQIGPGDEWRGKIQKALASTKVVILLVSQDFLASDFIARHELPYILDGANNGELTIFWIPIRASSYKNTPLEKYQSLGNPERPLACLKRAARELELVSICDKIAKASWPNPDAVLSRHPDADAPALEATSCSAREGIKALVVLLDHPAMQINVSAYKAAFGAACQQIETLSFYKDLHDLLHTLQFRCYNYLMNIARMVRDNPDDLTVWDNIIGYELTLQDIVDGLQAADERQQHLQVSVPWVAKLVRDLKSLFEAVHDSDVERIYSAIRPIQNVLAIQPARINDRLDEAVRALPLSALVGALSGLCDILDRKRVNAAMLGRFREGVQALSDLGAGLTSLTNAHSGWQEIDLELRRIEGNISCDLSELEMSWDNLKGMTEAQCAGVSEPWAKMLIGETRKLEGALGAKDAGKIRQYFLRYRNYVSKQFYKVDCTLKELCESLRRVGEPLSAVWEMVQ
jgi:hypothetical protein